MGKTIAILCVCVLTIGLVSSAYAHKAEVIGDYKIEIGWKHEPPIVGQENAIEIIVIVATEFDKESIGSKEHDESIEHEGMTHEEHEKEMKHEEEMYHEGHEEGMTHGDLLEPGEGVSNLSGKLEAVVNLKGHKTTLILIEQAKSGVYHAEYLPKESGFITVDLVGKIDSTEFQRTFHPEKIEVLSTLSPLKQVKANISPDDVECKEGLELLKSYSGKPACVSSSTASKLVSWGWGHR